MGETVCAVETAHYGVPVEGALEDATQSFDELELVVVDVETTDGERGVGFTYTIGEGGSAVAEFVDTTLRPVVDGGPAAPRAARDRLRAATTFVGREGISEFGVAAVDIALWDALGRRFGAPLYEVLGGTRAPVPAYETNGGWLQFDVDTLVENAERAAEEGFAGMKMKVGRSHAEDARRVRAVREVLPDGMDLMVDANCSYTVSEAQRFLRHLPDTPLAWLEVKQVLAHGGADVLQPDVCRVGTARSSRRPSPDTRSGSTGSTATESNSPRLGRR